MLNMLFSLLVGSRNQGLSARAVVESGEAPVVELGLVEKTGQDGGLGAGLYRPPLAIFKEACDALA